jgi:hypothetical protein
MCRTHQDVTVVRLVQHIFHLINGGRYPHLIYKAEAGVAQPSVSKFVTRPFSECSETLLAPIASFKHVISISSLNGLARKPIAPAATACARAFISGKAVKKMIGR